MGNKFIEHQKVVAYIEVKLRVTMGPNSGLLSITRGWFRKVNSEVISTVVDRVVVNIRAVDDISGVLKVVEIVLRVIKTTWRT